MSAKVVRLEDARKRTANDAARAEDWDGEAKFYEDLCGVVWANAHRPWREIAAEAKLAHQTVQRFASGETKRPTLITVRRLLRALHCDLQIVAPKTPEAKKPAPKPRRRK